MPRIKEKVGEVTRPVPQGDVSQLGLYHCDKDRGRKHLVEERVCSFTREARAGTPGRILEAGTEAEAAEECYLLAFFPWLSHPASLSRPQSTAQGWFCPKWSVPPHMDHQYRKCPAGLPTHQTHGGVFSIKNPSSQICLGLCQVTNQLS